VRSDSEEKWASIPSGAFGRLYHVLLNGLWTVSVCSMYVMHGTVWHGRHNGFRQYDHCVSRTKKCMFIKYSVFTLSTNELKGQLDATDWFFIARLAVPVEQHPANRSS